MQVGLFFYLSGGGLFASALCYDFDMATNAFAISRRLVEKGVDKPTADAVAEEIGAHSDESHASKADIARLEGKIEALATQVRLLMGLVAGLYVGFAAIFATNLAG